VERLGRHEEAWELCVELMEAQPPPNDYATLQALMMLCRAQGRRMFVFHSFTTFSYLTMQSLSRRWMFITLLPQVVDVIRLMVIVDYYCACL
jgi:hypothetical protein